MKAFFKAFLAASIVGQAVRSQLQSRAASLPSCALDCMETLVPEYCGSLTNTTCVCTDATLTEELDVCAIAACNVTDIFRLEEYKADLCGVVSDRSRFQEQLNTYYVLPALATLFIAARMYSRATMESIGPDDWMMVAAWTSYMIDVVFGVLMLVEKFGLHTYYLSTKQVEMSLLFFYVCELWYIITITLTKLSLLLFFVRIFPQKKFKMSAKALGTYTSVSNFAVLMALIFQCVPFHGSWTNWEYKVAPVKCINTYTVVYFAAGNSIFQDLVIWVMPIPTLLKLKLDWRKKVNLLIVFSVGAFVILCSILRLPSLIRLKTSSDPSWDQGPIAVWTNLEQSVGIICGSLPACRSLIGHLFPSLKMTFSKNSQATPPPYAGYSSRGTRPMKTKLTTSDHSSFMELTDQNPDSISKNINETASDSYEYVTQTLHSDENKARYGASTDIHAERGAVEYMEQGIVCKTEVNQFVSKS